MGQFAKFFGVCILLTTIYAISLLIFTKGFLLKRVVVERNSTCAADFTLQSDMHGREGCWMHSRFNKAVVIIVDALKFEFMRSYQEDTSNCFYKNKLPIITKLLQNQPLHSRLYRFIADPPTTTLQRLKGLTTGSLPTFVDAGSNFASSEIREDNVIDQLVKHRKQIKFLGDDTWMSLFPNRFLKTFPFPSLNVKDLHTVDDGILQHLYIELRKNDYSVLVAHFLGVDHCGHRFGPNHPAMAEKLSQMNEVISNVTSMADENTVVIVLGDHGMTSTGDHGGDSLDELEAGLFLYSPSQIVSHKNIKDAYDTVAQIDLVPTLSLLLGVPIPYSNIGRVITDLFSHCHWWDTGASAVKRTIHMVKALRINAHQVKQYLLSYYNISSDFPISQYYDLETQFRQAETDLQSLVTNMVKDQEPEHNMLERLERLQNVYENYITTIKETFSAIWAKFDLIAMAIGCLSFVIAVLINIYLLCCLRSQKDDLPSTIFVMFLFCFVHIVYAVFHTFFVGELISSLMAFLLGGFIIIYVLVLVVLDLKGENTLVCKKFLKELNFTWFSECCMPVLMCVLFFISRFSNSFVINEDTMTLFLIQTMIWTYCAQILKNIGFRQATPTSEQRMFKPNKKSVRKLDFMLYLTHPSLLTVYLCVLLSACVRISMLFRSCREEQISCSLSVFLQPLSSFVANLTRVRNLRYFCSILCLFFLVFGIRKLMRYLGNMNGTSPSVLCLSYVLPMSGACCGLHWAQQAIPQKILDSLPVWQQVLLPDVVYCLSVVSLAIAVCKPLCIFTVNRNKNFQVPAQENQVIPQLYQHFKDSLRSKEDDQPALVYGLGSVFSSSFINIFSIVSMMMLLLLGDGMAPSVFLMTLSLYLSLELFATLSNSKRGEDNPFNLFGGVVFFGLLSNLFFYNTGHQATVPSIRFEAAYVGFHGDFNYYFLPAALITMNTFAAHILCMLASPLLFMWPLVGGTVSKLIASPGLSEEKKKGDFILQEQGSLLNRKLFQMVLYTALFHGLKVCSSLVAASLHRRHLMVWKIFAPRFVFESVMFFVVLFILVCDILFVKNIEKSLAIWCKTL